MRRTLGAGLLLVFAVAVTGCRSRIQQGLDERQANEIVTLLAERGVSAEKQLEAGKKPSWTIEVRQEDAAQAVRMLAELGLPRARTAGFSELFGKGSLVPSASEERTRFLQALSGELARTLEAFEGVVAARVHLVLPMPPRPGQPVPLAKASAFLRVRPGGRERLLGRADELRSLVAGGAEGLVPEAVTLVIEEVSFAGTPPTPSSGTSNRRLRALAMMLALAVLGLAVGLILLTVRLRALRCRLATQTLSSERKNVLGKLRVADTLGKTAGT